MGIELDHAFERGQAALVHVGVGPRDLAQRGCFERAAIPLIPGNGEAAFIGEAAVTPGDPRVVEPLVGEARPYVTAGALAFATEQFQAGLLENISIPDRIPD